MSSSSLNLLPASHFIALFLSASVFLCVYRIRTKVCTLATQLWYNLLPSCITPSFPSTPFILLYVYASLTHYSITWRCCVWCVWWSSCSPPLRPINRSLNHVAFVFCICLAGRASWRLLGRLHRLVVPNWWLSLILSVWLSFQLSLFAMPSTHIHTLQSYDSLRQWKH